jgi:putative effector of murein hydrolase
MVWGSIAVVTGLIAVIMPSVQPAFFVASTVFSFVFASRLPRFIPPAVNKFWHPLMSTYVVATVLMVVQGALRGKGLAQVLDEYLIPGATWDRAAGNFIMYFLEPAIISFSFGLYRRKRLLSQNAAAILAGSFSSAFTGILTMALLTRLVGVPRQLALALMPRATAALAVVQAGMISASTALTTVHCCIIGVLGANFATALLDAMKILNPIARGVAAGGSGLALSSAALATTDPAAFPFGTLTMSLTSTIATALWSFPAFQKLVFWTAGMPRVEPVPVAVTEAVAEGVKDKAKGPLAQVVSFVQNVAANLKNR